MPLSITMVWILYGNASIRTRRKAEAATQRPDLGLYFGRQPRGVVMRPRRAIQQARFTMNGITVTPLAHRLGADALCRGNRRHRPAARQAHHQHSAMPRRARILMNFHPGLRVECCVSASHCLPAQPGRTTSIATTTSCIARRIASVVVALPWRTRPIVHPSTRASRLHHQIMGSNNKGMGRARLGGTFCWRNGRGDARFRPGGQVRAERSVMRRCSSAAKRSVMPAT
jgi:hypothetical protein